MPQCSILVGIPIDRMKSDGTYWTIHITPEPEFSYVSFETNLSQTSYDDLIRKVVEVFKPGKFVTTLFKTNQSSKCRTVLSSPQKIEGLNCLDCQSTLFNDYNFVFTSFAREAATTAELIKKHRRKMQKRTQ